MKKWQYHSSYNYKLDDKKVTMASQVYQTGIYVCVEGVGPRFQISTTPNAMIKQEKQLIIEQNKGIVKDLEFGMLITVVKDKEGFYKQLQ
jgi:hypothetical protein